MRAVIVYFSLSGNTKCAAEQVAEKLGADIIELKTEKPYPKGTAGRYFCCGKSAVFGESPKLKQYEFEVDKYDLVILGTPVWAGTFAPALRTFLKEQDLKGKKTALLATSSDGDAVKCFQALKKELGEVMIIETVGLSEPLEKPCSETENQIEEFCKMVQEN